MDFFCGGCSEVTLYCKDRLEVQGWVSISSKRWSRGAGMAFTAVPRLALWCRYGHDVLPCSEGEGDWQLLKLLAFLHLLPVSVPGKLQLPGLIHSWRVSRVGQLERSFASGIVLESKVPTDARPSKNGETPHFIALSKRAARGLETQNSNVYSRVWGCYETSSNVSTLVECSLLWGLIMVLLMLSFIIAFQPSDGD